MARYFIRSENTEDTFDSAASLQEAVRLARECVQKSHPGELVCIQHDGLNVMQFSLAPDGSVSEKTLVEQRMSVVPPNSAPSNVRA
jgi:hypothetical protein